MTPCPAASPAPSNARPPQPPPQPRKPSTLHVSLLAVALAASSIFPTSAVLAQAPLPDGVDTAIAYCTNLADEASDARFARQAAKLEAMEAAVQERLAALEAKRAEYQAWLERRETFLARAQESLVSIYSGMRPDAASEQLAAMEELTAAAIVAKLSPRAASAVLNEMATDKAARLATIMSGMVRQDDNRASAG